MIVDLYFAMDDGSGYEHLTLDSAAPGAIPNVGDGVWLRATGWVVASRLFTYKTTSVEVVMEVSRPSSPLSRRNFDAAKVP